MDYSFLVFVVGLDKISLGSQGSLCLIETDFGGGHGQRYWQYHKFSS